MGNGEWQSPFRAGVGNGEWGMESGRTLSGREWGMGNGEWQSPMDATHALIPYSLLPTPYSPFFFPSSFFFFSLLPPYALLQHRQHPLHIPRQ